MGRLCHARFSILILLGYCAWSKANLEDYPNCTGLASLTGNGECDSDNNNESCGWDGGDCCECTCVLDLDVPITCSVFDCLDPSSECGDPGTHEHRNCTGNLNYANNSLCNSENNNEACGWDGGDCCECTCVANHNRNHDCPYFACLDPNSECADSRLQEYINCTGDLISFGDGACNSQNNNEACGWDGGDCCDCTCESGEENDCKDSEFFCKDSKSDCLDPIVAEHPNCGGDLSSYGDSLCDPENNNEACGWDGGDCCDCTCEGHKCLFTIFTTGFNCTDPNGTGNEEYGCLDWPPRVPSCFPKHRYAWVENMSQAQALAEALNCSGGVFHVTWSGNVVVNQTLFVLDGTVLNLTGNGSNALMDGGGSTGLFNIVNASLYVNNIALVNGSSISGGAIAAFNSSVSLDQTMFIGNVAKVYGGALYAVGGSTVAGSGQIRFDNNSATRGGGALYARNNSHVSWRSGTIFSKNSAGIGGAMYIAVGSSVLWDGPRDNEPRNNVAWGGVAIFENNTATFGGGMAITKGTARWKGGSIFKGNTADKSCGGFMLNIGKTAWGKVSRFEGNIAGSDGGGLCVSNGSASWTGATYFKENFAGTNGGALSGTTKSNISWAGQAIFSSNVANKAGGAIYMSTGAIASWSSVSNFVSNSASEGDGGGVFLLDGSTALWMGEATFANNSANDNGGALRVSPSSTIVYEGRTSFWGNSAGGDGGALYLGGNASWEGETVLSENFARSLGGAICVLSGGKISWSANTLFFNNTAESGGALIVASGSHVLWTAETNFSSNQALQDGGAVSFILNSLTNSSSLGSGESSSIFIRGRTNFAHNKCGWSGGALALSGSLSISTNVAITFFANSADVYGGAVYISSVRFGPEFHGALFDSNQAQVGGGVYSVASGTAVTTRPSTNAPVEHPITFDNCNFINNEAYATGGAVSSSSGRDSFIGTNFIHNVARGGGALHLAGTASFTSCRFEGNTADTGSGPAVSNIGYILESSDNIFLDNILSCEKGYFLQFIEGQEEDLWEVVCDGCHDVCLDCDFGERIMVPDCISLADARMEHASSSGGITTLEELEIDQGYWRATPISKHVLECYNGNACRGGLTGAEDYCSEGYHGAYCSVCDASYTASLNFFCTPCTARKWGIMIAGIASVIGLVVGIAAVFHLFSPNVSGSGGNFVDRVARFVPFQSIKIIIVAWQIVTQFASVANVTFPEIYQRFLDAVDILNFDVSFVLSAGCVFRFDFHDKLLIVTVGPIVGLALLGVTYTVGAARYRCSEAALRNIRHKHMSMVILITFLVYSSVSSMVFQTFACEVLDDGKNYLRADYRIDCDSAKHKALQIYSGIMMMLYPVGIPLLYAALLFKGRNVLRKALGGDVSSELMSISDLLKPYKSSRFYYEIIECVRRIALTGAVVFIYPNTAAQIAMTLVMAFFFTVVSEGLAPYDSGWDCWVNRTGHVIVFLSMYVALLLKVEVSSERASSQKLLASILVAAQACMVLAAVVEAVIMACSVTTLEIDAPRPRVTARLPFRRVKDGIKIGVSTFDGIEASTSDAELESKSHG